MKIAIATQPLMSNYGGILQNYALQQVLIRMGHEPITLRYDTYSRKDWLRGVVSALIKGPLVRHRFESLPQTLLERNTNFRGMFSFMKKYLHCTKPSRKVYSEKFIREIGADMLLVGSDQTWRPLNNIHVLASMFGDFLPREIPCVSYAASFGTDIWEFTPAQTQQCSKLLKKFKAVSVREESGVVLCDKYLDRKDVQWVLDPTMLLTRKDYEILCDQIPNKEKTLFAYILDLTPEKYDFIQRLANFKHLQLLLVSAHDTILPDDSPEKWLSYFRDAEFIVTDSFHGTAFSIIFGVNFLALYNPERGNARFDSLIKLFSIKKQLIHNIQDFSFNEIKSPSWDNINKIREEARNLSFDFLQKNIKKPL